MRDPTHCDSQGTLGEFWYIVHNWEYHDHTTFLLVHIEPQCGYQEVVSNNMWDVCYLCLSNPARLTPFGGFSAIHHGVISVYVFGVWYRVKMCYALDGIFRFNGGG